MKQSNSTRGICREARLTAMRTELSYFSETGDGTRGYGEGLTGSVAISFLAADSLSCRRRARKSRLPGRSVESMEVMLQTSESAPIAARVRCSLSRRSLTNEVRVRYLASCMFSSAASRSRLIRRKATSMKTRKCRWAPSLRRFARPRVESIRSTQGWTGRYATMPSRNVTSRSPNLTRRFSSRSSSTT